MNDNRPIGGTPLQRALQEAEGFYVRRLVVMDEEPYSVWGYFTPANGRCPIFVAETEDLAWDFLIDVNADIDDAGNEIGGLELPWWFPKLD